MQKLHSSKVATYNAVQLFSYKTKERKHGCSGKIETTVNFIKIKNVNFIFTLENFLSHLLEFTENVPV